MFTLDIGSGTILDVKITSAPKSYDADTIERLMSKNRSRSMIFLCAALHAGVEKAEKHERFTHLESVVSELERRGCSVLSAETNGNPTYANRSKIKPYLITNKYSEGSPANHDYLTDICRGTHCCGVSYVYQTDSINKRNFITKFWTGNYKYSSRNHMGKAAYLIITEKEELMKENYEWAEETKCGTLVYLEYNDRYFGIYRPDQILTEKYLLGTGEIEKPAPLLLTENWSTPF